MRSDVSWLWRVAGLAQGHQLEAVLGRKWPPPHTKKFGGLPASGKSYPKARKKNQPPFTPALYKKLPLGFFSIKILQIYSGDFFLVFLALDGRGKSRGGRVLQRPLLHSAELEQGPLRVGAENMHLPGQSWELQSTWKPNAEKNQYINGIYFGPRQARERICQGWGVLGTPPPPPPLFLGWGTQKNSFQDDWEGVGGGSLTIFNPISTHF